MYYLYLYTLYNNIKIYIDSFLAKAKRMLSVIARAFLIFSDFKEKERKYQRKKEKKEAVAGRLAPTWKPWKKGRRERWLNWEQRCLPIKGAPQYE